MSEPKPRPTLDEILAPRVVVEVANVANKIPGKETERLRAEILAWGRAERRAERERCAIAVRAMFMSLTPTSRYMREQMERLLATIEARSAAQPPATDADLPTLGSLRGSLKRPPSEERNE